MARTNEIKQQWIEDEYQEGTMKEFVRLRKFTSPRYLKQELIIVAPIDLAFLTDACLVEGNKVLSNMRDHI